MNEAYQIIVPILMFLALSWLSSRYSKAYYAAKGAPPKTLEDKIRKLLWSSEETMYLVSDIEAEIRERKAIVEKLQSDSHSFEQLASLNKDQAEEVSRLLKGQLRSESKRTFWQAVAVNALFFGFGIIATLLIGAGA